MIVVIVVVVVVAVVVVVVVAGSSSNSSSSSSIIIPVSVKCTFILHVVLSDCSCPPHMSNVMVMRKASANGQ